MTKFNVHLTQRKSRISGLMECREAAGSGIIASVLLTVLSESIERHEGVWRRVPIESFAMEADIDGAVGVLAVEGLLIEPREFILEELTRHEQTAQAFIPCNSPFLVAVALSVPEQRDLPDRRTCEIVRCKPGQAIVVEKGVWHTLPFACSNEAVKSLTVVHRLPLGTYHDVRDLPAQGWFAEIIHDA